MRKNKNMNRRTFGKLMAVGATALSLNPIDAKASTFKKKVKPLKKGSKIGLIAPASRAKKTFLDKAKENMKSFGFDFYHTDKILDTHGRLGGTDEHRLSEIHKMYADKSIDAIWAVNGGYGATRLLDRLDFGLIKRNPKPLIGFSDITALLNTIQQKTGSPCFHGSNAFDDFSSDYIKEHLKPLFGIEKPFTIGIPERYIEYGEENIDYKYRVITPGVAKGKIVGGNLSLLVSLVGTRHAVKTKNKLVFIEDVGEQPYRIDRMLTHLISSGFFKNVRGVILGIFYNCQNSENDKESFSLHEVVNERMRQLNVPSVYGFPTGHIKQQCTLPIGVEAELNTEAKTVTLLQDAFQ